MFKNGQHVKGRQKCGTKHKQRPEGRVNEFRVGGGSTCSRDGQKNIIHFAPGNTGWGISKIIERKTIPLEVAFAQEAIPTSPCTSRTHSEEAGLWTKDTGYVPHLAQEALKYSIQDFQDSPQTYTISLTSRTHQVLYL